MKLFEYNEWKDQCYDHLLGYLYDICRYEGLQKVYNYKIDNLTFITDKELETILDKVDSHDFTEIYVFDVHTGLGSYGNLSIMVPECTYRELSNLYCNSQTSMINITNNNMYQDSVGSVVTGIEHYFRHNKCYPGSFYPVILEYGTYSNLRIFAGLLMENYYFTQKNKDWGLSKNTLSVLRFES